MGISKNIKDRNLSLPLNMWLKENINILLFGFIFLAGILLGSAISSKFSKLGINTIISISNNFIEKREEQETVKTFISALIPNAAIWSAAFIGGFCAVSAPITYLIPCIKGMGYGMLACSAIISNATIGIGYICIHLLPNLVISAIVMAFCCRDSIAMSKYFWASLGNLSRLQSGSKITPSIFCGKMILYGMLLIFSAVIEAYSYKLI